MKDRIEILLNKVGKIMQEQLANKQYGSATSVSPLLERIHHLQSQYSNIEHELADIETAVKRIDPKVNGHHAPSRFSSLTRDGSGRAGPKTLRISIDWKANKRSKEKEEIFFSKATESMVEFVGRVIEEFGDQALAKLSQLRVNRGPLLSRTPARDFGGYQNKRIRGTEYFLLTHSSTLEKVDALREVVRALGMVPGSVEIEAVERFAEHNRSN